jgi:hypothetical protein
MQARRPLPVNLPSMKRRTALGIGLAAGMALGLFAHARMMHALEAQCMREVLAAGIEELKRQIPPPLPPRLRLVDQDRRGLHNPRGDYSRVWLERVDFRGADLGEADFRDAQILGCDFRGANLEHADLTAATYDAATRWPEGFDPEEHGAMP